METILVLLEKLQVAPEAINAVSGWEDQLRFLGIKLINVQDFSDLVIRFSFNILIVFFAVHFIYAKNSRRKDFYFSYLALGVIIFFVSSLFNSVKLELGFAFGLFAIFGIIRYRTDAIPIKEMTWLFVIIAISVINALSSKKVSYAELVFTNTAIIGALYLLEKTLMLKQEQSVKLIYEKIENINKENEDELMKDLKERTGINIKRIEIKKIDFMRDIAQIVLYYNVNGNSN